MNLGRNPLSIQVCFNDDAQHQVGQGPNKVVIPYQFRSVSIDPAAFEELLEEYGVS